jgi:hypothetical protein
MAEVRKKVFELAARGIPQEHIALVVDVSESTLKRRCPEELRLGALKANAAMAWTLYRLGVSGESPECAMFWMRCRVGWRDRGEMSQPLVEMRFTPIAGDQW